MKNSPDAHASNIDRRKLLGAAAWSAPVIAVAAATPFAAASSAGGTLVVTSGTESVRILPSVRTLRFSVRGAGGAAPVASTGGHQGSLLIGTLTLPAATVSRDLRIVVGNGGPLGGAGGTGYGNGGSGVAFSGGGGSAVLLGNTPLVVAGGGGSHGFVASQTGIYTVTNRFAPVTVNGVTVPSATSNGAQNGMTRDAAAVTGGLRWVGAPGLPGNGATGGAGGSTFSAPAATPGTRTNGTQGGSWNAGTLTPGNGANGLSAVLTVGTAAPTTASTGAGGGGYSGGGSGGHLRLPNLITIGGGGGGGNYVLSGATVTTNGASGLPPIATGGHGGRIEITWS